MIIIKVMYSLLVFLFSIGGWWAAFHYLRRYWNQNTAIVKNAVHFIHALFFIVFYKGSNTQTAITDSVMCSMGFYCFDTIYLLRQCALDVINIKRHAVYLIHHMIAAYGLWLAFIDQNRHEILHFYYLLEYSNFLLYISYHMHKACPEYKNAILVSECFQFVWYSYFRIVRFVLYFVQIRNAYFEMNYPLIQLGLILLFFMGLFWSFALFTKCASGLFITTTNEIIKYD